MLLADTQPSLLLQGETPRLIDEWQMAPLFVSATKRFNPAGRAAWPEE